MSSNTNNISTVYGRHAGTTVYVLGSGKSMDFFPPKFFRDKLTVGVNQVHRKFPCTYLVSHHGFGCQEVIDKDRATLVAAEYDCADYNRARNEFDGYYLTYRHENNQQCMGIGLAALDDPEHASLAVSASTMADAVHFAFHLGATTILLCGADHGRIDGEMNFEGYNDSGDGSNGRTQPEHLSMTEPLLLRLVFALRKRGVTVMSLNPWINFGLEGHKYSRPPVGTVYISHVDRDAHPLPYGVKPALAQAPAHEPAPSPAPVPTMGGHNTLPVSMGGK